MVLYILRFEQEGRGFDLLGFFYLRSPYSRTMALSFAQPITEVSTRNLPVVVKRSRFVMLTTSPPSEPIV
jgi:hypothetical protein